MSYKIGRILIENFKHINFAELDFYEKDLIVFDGPNGFGKTTLFDAVELVITGKISRVKNTNDGRYGYNDLLFTKQDDKDTIIRIEFYNDEQKFTVVRRFDHTTSLKAADRRPDNWELFELYLLDRFDSLILPENIVESKVIYSKLGLKDFSRYFSLFFYIQQEENTFFLRKSGKNRMSEIAQLFDTSHELEELSKLNTLKKELDKEQRNIDGQNGVLNQKKRLLETVTTGIKDYKEEDLVEVDYFQLLQGEILMEWDKKDVSVQKATKDLYIKDLRQLYDFVKNFDEFLESQKNKVIQKYMDDKKLLKDIIVGLYFLDKYPDIKEQVRKIDKLRNLKDILNKENLQNKLDVFPFGDLENFVDMDIDVKKIRDKLSLLESYKRNTSNISSIIQELNTTRDTLIKQFNIIHRHEIDSHESSCPLCGHDWISYEELIKSIQSKRESFQKYYDDSSKKYELEKEILFIEYLNPIIEWIDRHFEVSTNLIDRDFYIQLTKSISSKQDILKFIKWCSDSSLDIMPYINKEMKFVSNLEEKVESLERFLLSKKQPVKQGYTEFEEKSIEFASLYEELFQWDEEKVRIMELEDIVMKAKYINSQYYHKNSETVVLLNNEISALNEKLINVSLGIEKIKRIIEIYKLRISQHWQIILRDIEIPFYIYSGKILQDYQRGIGLFIKESEKDGAKNIKFVSDSNSDHDALNYLSSGQLSGLVIAFTLALNKVYGNNTMDILLIDDPVQTMDEINMVSFTELLRNEFRDKQIFLSTHEEDISRYLRYKFSKYNLETLRFNVKDKLYLE